MNRLSPLSWMRIAEPPRPPTAHYKRISHEIIEIGLYISVIFSIFVIQYSNSKLCGKNMISFKEYIELNNIQFRRTPEGLVYYQEKTVHSEHTGRDETYHIFCGCNDDGKVLFIPSLSAWDAAVNKVLKFSELEVEDGGFANDGVTPIKFLLIPIIYNGLTITHCDDLSLDCDIFS